MAQMARAILFASATGMKIIRAIVARERDPDVLTDYRDVRCKSSPVTIRAALVGGLPVEDT